MDDALFAQLGVKAQEAEHVEQSIIGQALADKATETIVKCADDESPHGLAEQLLAVHQEADTVAQAIAVQQQHATESQQGLDDGDSETNDLDLTNRQLEAAVMQQRLDSLQQRQQQLQQQLDALPAEQKHQALLHYHEQLEASREQQQQQGRNKKARQPAAGSSISSRAGGGRGDRSAAVVGVAGGLNPGAALDADAAGVPSAPKLVETERDRLIRIGVLTPFDKLEGFEMKMQGAAAAPAQQVRDVRFQSGKTVTKGQQQKMHPPATASTALAAQEQHLDRQQQQQEPQPDDAAEQVVNKSPAAAAAAAAHAAQSEAEAAVDQQWALLQQRAQRPAQNSRAAAGAAGDLGGDLAHRVGRNGLPLSDLLAKATQDSVEIAVTNRPRTVLMLPQEVPRQEREIIKVNPLLWRPGAANQGKVLSKRPPRRSTLPRQKRKSHALALHGSSSGRKRQRQQEEKAASSSSDEFDSAEEGEALGSEDGECVSTEDERGRGHESGGEQLSADDGSNAAEQSSRRVKDADVDGTLAAEGSADGLVVASGESEGQQQQQQRPSQTIRRRGRLRQANSSEGDGSAAAGTSADHEAAASGLQDTSDEDFVDDLLQQQQEAAAEADELADYDDVDAVVYETRLERYQVQLQLKRQQQQQQQGVDAGGQTAGDGADTDVVFEGGFRIPGGIWAQLFDYQRTGVKWLWELHNQRAGGIIGDEMGLGKTIQVIAYLAGLHHSGMWRPSLVVAPATVLRQWMTELNTWYPPLRVMLVHESGKSPYGSHRPDKAGILDAALSAADCSLVLTTYDQLRLQRDMLLPVRWGVAVLDEGHKIRNPDAEVTLAAKQLQTVHRIIMSGSPIQNRLSELWSLFDFIFPGKLGTLPVFTAQFAIPITIGGYTNASKLQVQTAYRCAVVLRDLINPYLLRRRKADVATQLPKKTETVLFCSLTEQQRDLYRAYINSNDVSEILAGQRQALAGIDVLRKICNHPDLLQRTVTQGNEDYGSPERSGKLQVLVKVLSAWHAEGHKVLLFTQTQQMLDILEKLVVGQGYSYHRMDGGTAITQRGRLIDDFNKNPDRFLFLLTTKVGGLGVNLTGANRVVIYDPDWNPSTDTQARERAWRIGQGRPVTIYRLITSGTIEEKVYHRQIYKSYLTNMVLQDPRQRRFFAARDISDLFTLADEHGGTVKHTVGGGGAAAAAATQSAGLTAATETERIFSGVVGEGRLTAAAAVDGGGASGSRRGSRQRQQQQQADEVDEEGAVPADTVTAGNGRVRSNNRSSRPPAVSSSSADPEQADDDSRVLRDLFEGTGVKSLIDHSSIESAHDSDALKADEHAAKVAARAAEALRQSRLACQAAAVNVPTWTGRHGSAGAAATLAGPRNRIPAAAGAAAAAPAGGGSTRGRFGQVRNPLLTAAPLGAMRSASPDAAISNSAGNGGDQSAAEGASSAAAASSSGINASRSLFAGRQAGTTGGVVPSSAALLAKMRERQQAAAAAGGGEQLQAGSRGADDSDSAAVRLAEQIVSFIQGAGGAANSDLLLSHFRDVLRDSDMPLFKQLLRQVAKLQPVPAAHGRGGGQKVWVLKDGYEPGT